MDWLGTGLIRNGVTSFNGVFIDADRDALDQAGEHAMNLYDLLGESVVSRRIEQVGVSSYE